jgi:proteic killer suppression protein
VPAPLGRGRKAPAGEPGLGKDGPSGIDRDKILSILQRKNGAAEKPQALNLPGYRFHQLKVTYRGFYSVTVTGNNRIIFRFVDGNAVDVDYLDYH